VEIDFEEIPHFQASTVHGHAGKMLFGTLAGRKVVALRGRYHAYEGFPLEVVTFPVRVFQALGAKVLILSNATGALNRNYQVGDLMVIEDFINWMQSNPLMGPNDLDLGPRFVDMSEPFSPRLRKIAQQVGREAGLPIRQGILVSVTGPNFETMAELRMLRRAGADAVGMSVIPEVIVAKHAGIPEVLGVSCITDMATGESGEALSHEQVLAAAKQAEDAFCSLITGVLEQL
jgi:purine-nucleoside phosphorylase